MKNKRGYLRIIEATIAVLIVTGVLISVYTRDVVYTSNDEEYIPNLQKQVLKEIESNEDFRVDILSDGGAGEWDAVEDYVRLRIPVVYGHSLRICKVGEVCKLKQEDFVLAFEKDVFVQETIVSATYNNFNPKKVRLFIWKT